ncbi:MAG: 23S rRNA (adenine(2503)-C(2))-methyltransferase RlmN [Dysgonamonadaceae bacterium]|nr:23S rRNA (adenine(2503)-C(2))-methyltransferase RlmN [Dysgonamonadaceae bacterium]
MTGKKTLLGKTLPELKQIACELGMPAYTAGQIADWLYKKRVVGIDEMTNLSLDNRNRLKETFTVGSAPPVQHLPSQDGTVKYLFATSGGHFVESVFIPEENRATLCVSSQCGCKMNCLFCMTGKQGFLENLSAQDIMNQIQSVPESPQLTNLVFMGMGEPIDNVEEVLKVLEILTADYGYSWSPKRITVSTVGLLPGLRQVIERSQCHLAVSIHSPFAYQREALMPVEKAYPIAKILELIREYDFSGQRRISFEYILFKNLNDDIRHAKRLVRLLAGIPCRVNLIKYHAIPTVDLESPDILSLQAFRDYLTSKGVTCTIRSSRGEDILAACGMLSTKENRIFASKKQEY